MRSTFLTTERVGNVVIARLCCEKFAEREATIVQTELAAAAKESSWRLAIDASEVMLLASVGLGALVTLNKDCKAGGGKLVVFAVTQEIREVLRLTRLERIITIVKDQDAALKSFA